MGSMSSRAVRDIQRNRVRIKTFSVGDRGYGFDIVVRKRGEDDRSIISSDVAIYPEASGYSSERGARKAAREAIRKYRSWPRV